MKKSILIGALAALMLFAFVACDGGTASAADRTIVAISVTDGPTEYFGGESIDLEDYTVMATQVNGDTVPVEAKYLSLDKNTVTAPADNSAVEPGVIATVTYNGPFMATYGLQADITASVYKMTGIDVEVNADQPTYYVGSATKDIAEDYTVTAYAVQDDEVVYEKVLTTDEFKATPDSSKVTATTGEEFTVAGACEVTFTANADSSVVAIEDGENTANIIVMKNYLVSFDVVLGGEGKSVAAVGGAIGTASDYVTVTYTMANGKVGDVAETGATAATISWENSATGNFTSGTSYRILAKASVGADPKEETKAIPVALAASTVKSFVVEEGAIATSIKGGYTLNAADLTVTLTWTGSSDVTYTAASDLSFILADGSRVKSYVIPANFPASTELPIEFALDTYPNATTTSTVSTTAN